MAYVPGFRYDLFVSYASADNADSWVERFQSQLTAELKRLLGSPFSDKTVFFDRLRLGTNQSYPEELDAAARDSAILVALLSPSYLKSDWCSRERRVFQERLVPGASFPQCLTAVRVRPCENLPQVLHDAQHADFVVEGFEEPWSAGSGKWIEIVNRLAVQGKQALQKLRNHAGAVFVGPTLSRDMDLRNRIVDYLDAEHFRAVPDEAVLDDRAACQKALAAAACAVHFIGSASDLALERLEDSIQHAAGRTITFTPYGAALSPAEQFFFEEIDPRNYPHRLGPDETDLKKFLQDLLTAVRAAAAPAGDALGFICEPADFAIPAARDLDYPRFLQEKLSAVERIRRWKAFLRERRCLLFYQGQSREDVLARVWNLAEEENAEALRRWYVDHPDLEAKRQRRPTDPVFPAGLDDLLREHTQRRKQGP